MLETCRLRLSISYVCVYILTLHTHRSCLLICPPSAGGRSEPIDLIDAEFPERGLWVEVKSTDV